MASISLRRMVGRWPWIALGVALLNGMGIAQAAQCDGSNPANPTNLNAYIALGAGNCSLPNSGGTIANIRYSATVSGGGTAAPPDTMGIVPFGPSGAATKSGLNLFFANFGIIGGTPASVVTINFAYTFLPPSGFLLSSYQFSNGLTGASGAATVTMSFCPGGTFTAFPPTGCPTATTINSAGVTSPPAGDSGVQNFPGAQQGNVDVYVKITGASGTISNQLFTLLKSTTAVTTSQAEVDTITTTNATPQRVDTYSTEVRARIGTGSFLYDQTFKVAFSDPQVVAAITQARNVLTGAGGVNLTGPTQISSSTSQVSSQTNTVTTGTQTQAIVNTNAFVGPVTVATGNLGICQSYTLSSSGYPLPLGCSLAGTPVDVASGAIDFDTRTLALVTISQTATATNTFLTTAVYEINGSGAPTPPATPLPPSLFLAVTGVATLGFSEWRRRRRARRSESQA